MHARPYALPLVVRIARTRVLVADCAVPAAAVFATVAKLIAIVGLWPKWSTGRVGLVELAAKPG